MATEKPLTYYLDEFWLQLQDPRTKHLFLVDIRLSTFILILSSYVIFSTKLGPHLMSNRKPFDLRTPMLIYNISMVIINIYFFNQVIINWDWGRKLLDHRFPSTQDTSPYALNIIRIGYWYWWSKFADLIDTIFFVLRKKQSHVSLLHVYHHSVVPFLGWIMLKTNIVMPGCLLFCLLNTLVHTVMYSYYALSSLGQEIQKYLWWKKYLTLFQLIQFAIYITYSVILAFFQTGHPPALFVVVFAQPFIFFYMFLGFYKQKYKSKIN